MNENESGNPAPAAITDRETPLLPGVLLGIDTIGDASLHHSARLIVIGELLRAICAHLPDGQKVSVALTFRDGIEGALARMDDCPLPRRFQEGLLSEVNGYLQALS